MTARILDGKALAAEVEKDVAVRVAARVAGGKKPPGLATIVIGDNPASHLYVQRKHEACQRVGMTPFESSFPSSEKVETVIDAIERCNEDDYVQGILVQLPLPRRLQEHKRRILETMAPTKNVDGLFPENMGKLAMMDEMPLFIPCTPAGCMRLIEYAGVELQGIHAVVLGRSNIVGRPMSFLLDRHDCTFTVCNHLTRNTPEICRTADILISATGHAGLIHGDWIKPGACVIDVGISRVPDASRKSGFRIVGDVVFDEAVQVAGVITPVPGGVGPMTIAMLMENTLHAAELQDPMVLQGQYPIPA